MGHLSVDDDDDVVEQESDCSESKEEKICYDDYESDHGISDCSVTSGLEDDHLQEASEPCSDTPAADATILRADESADTAWTDDKHSSYLDLIEATFVRKMYDKEYCSVDVCGQSSHSSITLEQDCVESHPFCLNMRKPYEQAIGLLPFRSLTRPWLSASSVLASPWIQRFKSKQGVIAKNFEAQKNATKMEQSDLLGSKKRGALFDTPDCNRSFHGSTASEFNKLKCQQAFSHMDIMMEEQNNTEQRNQDNARSAQQNQEKLQSDGTKEEGLKTQLTGIFEAGKARKVEEVPETSFSKKQGCAWKGVHPLVCLPESYF